MLEPQVLIALQNLYGLPFATSQMPPAIGDTVLSKRYANTWLIFDWQPGLVLPKVSDKAVAAEVARLNGDLEVELAIEVRRRELADRVGNIIAELEAEFPGYAALAYAEIVVGKPLLFFSDRDHLKQWIDRCEEAIG